MVVIVLVIVGH